VFCVTLVDSLPVQIPKLYPPLGARELRPSSFARWDSKPEDPRIELERDFHQWLTDLDALRAQFKKHVYDNPDACSGDFLQHRVCLFMLLTEGSRLVQCFSAINGGQALCEWPKADQAMSAEIEAILAGLFSTATEWHGPVNVPGALPESLVQSMAESAAGKATKFICPEA
jgi:hypothetical protein